MELLYEVERAYRSLEAKQEAILRSLRGGAFSFNAGWFNGHYHRDEVGEWCRESYPIPVIGVEGICDIEVQFDKISISAKLKRDDALTYSYEEFLEFDFEVYGVEDYLADFYHKGQSVQDMKENICASKETEIGFSFLFPFEIEGERVLDFLMLLRCNSFYY